MSSLFSCFGKKSRRKKSDKEPKNRKSKGNEKKTENADGDPQRESTKLSEATALLEKEPESSGKELTKENDIKVEEESSNPLLKELQNKLLERREKQSQDAKVDDNEISNENSTKELTKVPSTERNSTSTNVIVTTFNSCPTVVKTNEKTSKLELVNAELETISKELEQTKQEKEELRLSLEKAEKDAEEKYDELQQRYTDVQDKDEVLRKEIKDLTDRNKELKVSESKLQERCEEQNRHHEEEQKELLNAIADREDISKCFEELSKTCCGLDQRLEKLTANANVNHNNNDSVDNVARVNELGLEHESLNHNVKDLLRSIQEIECRVIRLEVSKDSLDFGDNKVEELMQEVKKTETAYQELKVDNQGLSNKLAEMTCLMQHLKDEKETALGQVAWITSEMDTCRKKVNDLQNSLDKKEREIENLSRSRSKAEEEVKLQSIRYQTLVSQMKEKDEECRRVMKSTEELKKKNDELEIRANKTTVCNGEKPRDIPNDKTNAPVLISDRFRTELYLSLWKDAYAKLTDVCRRDEKKSLQILMDFCTEAYLHCRRTARQQIDTVCSLLANPSMAHARGSNSRRSGSGRQDIAENIPEMLRKQILDFRKSPSKEFMDNLYEDFLSQLDFQKSRHLRSFHMKEMNEITPYINKCLEISWEMVVQDPPMYLQFKVRHGTEIDRDKFECYSHNGRVVDYLVWPALLREENGAVLQTGVVQAVMSDRS